MVKTVNLWLVENIRNVWKSQELFISIIITVTLYFDISNWVSWYVELNETEISLPLSLLDDFKQFDLQHITISKGLGGKLIAFIFVKDLMN